MSPDAAPSRAVLWDALRVLGMLWTLPNTVLGLIAGTVGIAFGARAHLSRRDLAIVFHRWPWGPGGALTLGNTILHTGDTLDSECMTYAHRAGHGVEPAINMADHERAHVYQYMALGALFLPLYFLCGGISVRNRFERAADRYAQSGNGWWPWWSSDERSHNFTQR
ncbi:MAG: hypothetical protein ABJA62_00580 [Luteimonas sp.]